MLSFYRALEIITSSAMVCDIWTDVRTGLWDGCIMGHYCDNRKALSSYIIIMAHVGFPSRRFLDMLGVFVWCFLKSLCLTGCLALVDHPSLKSYLFFPPAGVSYRWGSWFLWNYFLHPEFWHWNCTTNPLYHRQGVWPALHPHNFGPGWGIGQVWLGRHSHGWGRNALKF